ncbi:unnamed protein product [Blepharisma stoltei]|uniref:RING-type domain-containing protein n=1 Tax=Blepharisma stoltei TaxID=1481888 RepID=A0AAU9JE98_9CILI|nr:unnamed protein product [Blepharisma stoltei]
MYILLNLLLAVFLKQATTESIPSLQTGKSLSVTQESEWSYFQLILNSPSKVYIRVSLKILQKPDTSEPVLSIGHDLPSFSSGGLSVNADMIDYDGWFTQCGYHSLIFQSSSISSSSVTYIGISNYNYEKGQISYKISIEEDDYILCPQDCNSRGVCVSLNVCECQNGYIGVGCESQATEITQNNLYSLNAPCQGVNYAYINRQKVSDDALKFYFGWTKYSGRLFWDYKGRGVAELPSPRNYFYQVLLPDYNYSLKVDLDVKMMSNMIYMALYNDLNCTSENFNLYVKLSGSSLEENDILVYVLPTLGVLLFIIVVILGVMYYKHRRHRKRSIGLSLTKINEKFPLVQYSEVSSKTSDKNCAICLDEFLENSLVRKLYCNHIFHDHCIKRWLKMSKICYICKQDCAGSPEELLDVTQEKEIYARPNTVRTYRDEAAQPVEILSPDA